MNNNVILYIEITLCAMLAFSSCEKIPLQEDEDSFLTITNQGNATAKLNITARAGDSDEDNGGIVEGQIYVFNSAGKCVQLLHTDEESNKTTVQLSAGSYTLYAIVSDDLSRYSLPTQTNATPTSIITRKEGKVLDDLLMAKADVELKDGETVNQNITLEHKVLCVDEIEIKQVPLTATKVEVSFIPLYSSVQLNGIYPVSPTESYKFALTKQPDEKTWKVTPQEMLFPSQGNPTIKVSITTEEGIMGYSYNATEELVANHHFTIIGTYIAAQGVSLTGILTAAGWGDDRTIIFDIGDQVIYEPIAGQFCNGYYVVSVNEGGHTAVLLSPRPVNFAAPENSDAASADLWKKALEEAMVSLEVPKGISGSWRLPTLEEAKIFTGDLNSKYKNSSGNSVSVFCLAGNELRWAETKKDEGFKSNTTNFSKNVYLAPVIDITY